MPAFINRGVPTHAKLFPYNYQTSTPHLPQNKWKPSVRTYLPYRINNWTTLTNPFYELYL